MSRLRHLSALAAVVLLPSCVLPVDVEFTTRSALEPRPEFFVWYWMTEACSGLSGDASRVRWFSAGGIVTGSERPVANWSKPHEITMLVGFERNQFVVRHEVLHDLLGGDPLHTAPAWDGCQLRTSKS